MCTTSAPVWHQMWMWIVDVDVDCGPVWTKTHCHCHHTHYQQKPKHYPVTKSDPLVDPGPISSSSTAELQLRLRAPAGGQAGGVCPGIPALDMPYAGVRLRRMELAALVPSCVL
jgi:hypothetical protein